MAEMANMQAKMNRTQIHYDHGHANVALNDHEHKVGIGAVVTNSKGDIVASMSSPFDGILSPLFAEAKVLLWALRRRYSSAEGS
ncbi:hypothetical protein G4B88_005881 [Cannabis sativa]|uniref:RNase H type-1 domain-containing protein n=1 Tax=Cannabis sativa TaxID=3483 RepID=A0A7J6IBD8_CANSA|nr:hypothetical protein G4B88_005881 [Cannabis sativa]